MIRRIRRTLPWFGAVAALLLLALPVQADEIEPEPYVEEKVEEEAAPETAAEPDRSVEKVPDVVQVDYSREGCYLGLGGTTALPNNAEDWVRDATRFEDADVNKSLGLNARAGCRGKWGGGELHYEWMEGFDYEAAGRNFTVDAWAFTLDGKVYPLAGLEDVLPSMAKRFQPFTTVGFGYLDIDLDEVQTFLNNAAKAKVPPVLPSDALDDWDFALRVGGGMDIYLTRNIAINVDATYVLPLSNDLNDLDYLSIGWGFLYRF
jgi:opacity protein-like surface antigen